ncbi:hypothetical protein HDU92_008775 [Lobulomyces angularis]|nr:hypothetical protein HDU92_008775 [Lobulomyces angularis]
MDSSTSESSSTWKSFWNLLNAIIGSSVFSAAFAFKLSGWLGIIITVLLASISYSTLIFLEKSMIKANSNNFTQIAKVGFGRVGYIYASIVLTLDMFFGAAMNILLVTKCFNLLYPDFEMNLIKLVTVTLLIPFTWFESLGVLSYTSFLGTFAICLSLVVLVYDGLSTTVSPGSLINTAETAFLPNSLFEFPLAFGLLYSTFVCHVVAATIYHEMKNKSHYKRMIIGTLSYVVTFTLVFATIGYLMYGDDVPAAATDILLNPIYHLIINKAALWFLIVCFTTKFPLFVNTLAINIEFVIKKHCEKLNKKVYFIFFRTSISVLILVIIIIIPEFQSIVSILGSLIGSNVAILLPCLCHVKLNGGKNWNIFDFRKKSNKKKSEENEAEIHASDDVEEASLNSAITTMTRVEFVFCWILIFFGILLAIFGTIWSFLPIS